MFLNVEQLKLQFHTPRGPIQALRDVSFQLQEGETLGVVGESGCGKSLTNLCLMGLLPNNAQVNAFKCEFQGQDLLKAKESDWKKIRGPQISMIFQDPMSALNPAFSVKFQIHEVLNRHRKDLTKKEKDQEAINLLGQVGIPAPEERLSAYPHQLSGGMAQRVMIAMALAGRPKLLLADEPTTALDVTIQKQIMNLLKDLQKEYAMAMILVSHDLAVIAQNSSRLLVMYAGEVIETNETDKLISEPQHPYTQGLIDSLPNSKERGLKEDLYCIQGMVPSLTNRPQGCQFHPRCPQVKDDCKSSNLHLIQKDSGKFRCLYPLGANHE